MANITIIVMVATKAMVVITEITAKDATTPETISSEATKMETAVKIVIATETGTSTIAAKVSAASVIQGTSITKETEDTITETTSDTTVITNPITIATVFIAGVVDE